MSKLNQIIAIEKGIKAKAYAELTDLNKIAQKADLFNGFFKVYKRKSETGEEFPPESKKVQFTVPELLARTTRGMTESIQVTARKDNTNCSARASVIVDGVTLAENAPATFLIFLEKTFEDFKTFVSNLPVLEDSENWTWDENSQLFKSDASQTHRTKKVQKAIVLYDATEHHPAQTQLITEDDLVGYWHQTKVSGAIPKKNKQVMVERIDKLINAVKEAREAANMVEEIKIGDVSSRLFEYILKS